MKMKKSKKIVFFIILIVIISVATFNIGKQVGLNTDTPTTKTTVEEQTVGTQTIKKTLTSSGEIQTATTEKIALDTTKYFETMCIEEDDTLKAGENILKYTDGTYLTAPYDCVISSYLVPETGTKASSDNYVEIKDLTNLLLSLSINENEIIDVNLDTEVEITLTADETKTYIGKITKIDSSGTYMASGSTFGVEVQFENDGYAKIGMSASCTIILQELNDVIAVPINAVKTSDDKKYVVVVDDGGQTKEVEIETGISNDEYVEVTNGLTGGEKIQITTTVTENTIRSSSSSDERESMGGQRGMMGGMQDGGGSMPNMEMNMGEGRPSGPNN